MSKVSKKELRKTALKLLPVVYESAMRTGEEDGLFQHEDWRTGLCLDAFLLAEAFEDASAYRESESEPKLKQLDQSVFDGLDEKWRFAAVNKLGCLMLSTAEMVNINGYWGRQLSSAELCNKEGGYDASNCQNSLIERKELTGSDLCRAMLERGDKFVVCKLADTSEADAISNSMAKLVTEYDGDGFYHELADSYWYFAVPINNQGEPLTAADVGL